MCRYSVQEGVFVVKILACSFTSEAEHRIIKYTVFIYYGATLSWLKY